ncbi:uncharacterized protein LOC109835157 [Asparagus officinalis]|uniref:uncharacterized protein LOC109835157 n=1 Tax=Asparagus officinalis TaxID=4686 RepID=UPI00098E3A7C|nr:uncharacterized protein LOC109835157 [Asparagus officinalis]
MAKAHKHMDMKDARAYKAASWVAEASTIAAPVPTPVAMATTPAPIPPTSIAALAAVPTPDPTRGPLKAGHQQRPVAPLQPHPVVTSTPGISASPLLADCTSQDRNQANVPATSETSTTEQPMDRLIKVVDISSREADRGAGVVLRSPGRLMHEQSITFSFSVLKNEAKYKALLAGLRAALALKVKRLYILVDSQLIAHHVNGQYTIKDPRMVMYLKVAKELLANFKDFKIA